MTCHGATSATGDGNATYVLSTAPPPIPDLDDAASIQEHRAFMGRNDSGSNNSGSNNSGSRDQSCASCYRGFLTPETGHGAAIAGINDFTPWRRSAYSGNTTTRVDDPIEVQDCVDCHMPRYPDGRRSHRFAGGHATLAAAIGSKAQLQAVRDMVEGAATIDLGGWGVGSFGLEVPTKISAGQRIIFDVVVFNEKVGHRFPGGAMDLRDTWIEVIVRDQHGATLAISGVEYADPSAATDTAAPHKLRALLVSTAGSQVDNHRVHEFSAPVFNHTIDARDEAIVRYAWDAPTDIDVATRSLRVDLRLLQRRHMPSLAMDACDNLDTDRGRDFQAFTKKYTGLTVDPCIPQPIIEVARFSHRLHDPLTDDWRRMLLYGMALRHSVQEKLQEAQLVLEQAHKLAEQTGGGERRPPESQWQPAIWCTGLQSGSG